MATATFGAGCFWCVEAVFQRLDGVLAVQSGYTGGHLKNPTYRQICDGTTGHAEVCQITYDPSVISYVDLLQAFFYSHDPTTLNRQGNDTGTQYRSVIFYHDDQQLQQARQVLSELDAAGLWPDPVVTTVEPLTEYYPAEDYHQNYYNQNGDQPYCTFVIKPKLEKFNKVFTGKLKNQTRL